MSSFPLTNSYFFRWLKPATSYNLLCHSVSTQALWWLMTWVVPRFTFSDLYYHTLPGILSGILCDIYNIYIYILSHYLSFNLTETVIVDLAFNWSYILIFYLTYHLICFLTKNLIWLFIRIFICHFIWHSIWHSIWNLIWHYIWHSVWQIYIYIYVCMYIYIYIYVCIYVYIYIFWDSTRHTFCHSVWHVTWNFTWQSFLSIWSSSTLWHSILQSVWYMRLWHFWHIPSGYD